VFQLIGRTDGARWTQSVREIVAKTGVIDKVLLVRHLTQTLSLGEIKEGIAACEAAGYIVQKVVNGRPLVCKTDLADDKVPHGESSSQASANF
jgi:hypothetical protein